MRVMDRLQFTAAAGLGFDFGESAQLGFIARRMSLDHQVLPLQTSRLKANRSRAALYEDAVQRGEGIIAADGPLVCLTGQHTGRSPNDKFFVREPSSDAHIAWGDVNRPMEAAHFATLRDEVFDSMAGRDAYSLDCL